MQLNSIRQVKINEQKIKLQKENALLLKEVELAKEQLIKLEIANGKKQILIPNTISTSPSPITDNNAPPAQEQKQQQHPQHPSETQPQNKKEAKEKKPKKEKATSETTAAEEPPIDIGRLDLRVGKIIEVSRHPDADSLYLEKIDCGEENLRTVVSGLVKFVPIEEMQNRMVVVLCNLKPAKMRGVTSEAMVMCASTPEKVEILSPPIGSVPGDLVHCDGYARKPDAQMNPKKKIFETVAPFLKTNDSLQACYKDAAWTVPDKGHVLSQTLKSVQVK